MKYWIVPEDVHISFTEGLVNSRQMESPQRPKNLRESMNVNNFEFAEGQGVFEKIRSVWGVMDVFRNYSCHIC